MSCCFKTYDPPQIREQLATMGVVGSAAHPMVAQLKSSLQDDRFSAKLHDVLKLQTQPPQVGGWVHA